jgi:hypothetical protein
MEIKHLEQFIIIPTLSTLQIYSESAKDLLVLTYELYNKEGITLHHEGSNAYGIYGMTGISHTMLWYEHLRKDTRLVYLMTSHFKAPHEQHNDRLVWDLRYSTAMMALHYYFEKAFQQRSKTPQDLYKTIQDHHPNPKMVYTPHIEIPKEEPTHQPYQTPNPESVELIESLEQAKSEAETALEKQEPAKPKPRRMTTSKANTRKTP